MKKKEKNFYDEKMDELYFQFHSAKDNLNYSIGKVIVAQGVVNLYPEGPDKKTAEEAADKAKRSLVCHIGAYDSCRAELINYYDLHKDDFSECRSDPRDLTTSHTRVEFEYKNFFCR